VSPAVNAAKESVETAEMSVKKAEGEERYASDAFTQMKAQVSAYEKTLADLEDRYNKSVVEITNEDSALRAEFGRFAPEIEEKIEVWVEKNIAVLAKSRKAHASADKERQAAQRLLENAEQDEKHARVLLAEKQAERSRVEQVHNTDQQRLTALCEEIATVTKSDDPEADLKAIDKQIKSFELARSTASNEAANAKIQLTAAQEALKQTADHANKALEVANARAKERDQSVTDAGFKDEASVRSAQLQSTAIEQLEATINKYYKDLHTVENRVKDLGKALGNGRVSDADLKTAEMAMATLDAEVENQHGKLKSLEAELAQMKKSLKRSKILLAELEKEQQSLQIYKQLAGDLRSDKFQAYLLEEVFTELVKGASDRLLNLTGERYSLLFKDEEILVVDNDNAGETRISDTLSGGETFLTSLSLALELSDQVQRAAGAVNLDSLFIDEGFGTLDPDTLALVSETIQSLRVGGRMVGIITHIPELRDEFAQQILVTKHQGYSTVEIHGAVEEAVSA